MVAEHRAPPHPESPAHERADGLAEQTGVAGGVEVGPVVERVRVAGQLHAEVAVRPAAGMDDAPAQDGQRLGELVALVVVDQIAALDHEVGAQRLDRPRGAGEHLGGERLVRAERRLERRAEAIEERHPRRR